MKTSWTRFLSTAGWWVTLIAALVGGMAERSAGTPPTENALEDVADSIPRSTSPFPPPIKSATAPVTPQRGGNRPPDSSVPDVPTTIRDERDVPEVIRPNLVQDSSFGSFHRPQAADPEAATGAWGTGAYSRHGLWWASGNAQVAFRSVPLNRGVNPPGATTALEIANRSPARPHTFGTTSQRIPLESATGRYWITLWARASDLKSRGGVQVVVDRAWKVRPISLAEGTYGWRYHSGAFEAADVDTAHNGYLDLRLLSQDSGDVQVTGVTLRRAVKGEASRILALVVIDSDPKVRPLVEADQRMVAELLKTMFAGRGQLTVLEHADATPAKVLEYYRTLQSQSDDTLFFYYAGHGATEVQKGHALTMVKGILYRQDLLTAIRSQPAQLKIVITECCANFFEARVAPREVPRMFHPDVVHGLFLRNRGLVDLTASSPGQFATGNEYGGVFGRSLIAQLQAPPDELDANRNGLVTWPELFARVQASTHELFRQQKEAAMRSRPEGDALRQALEGQTSQIPYAFALDALPTFRLDPARRAVKQ